MKANKALNKAKTPPEPGPQSSKRSTRKSDGTAGSSAAPERVRHAIKKRHREDKATVSVEGTEQQRKNADTTPISPTKPNEAQDGLKKPKSSGEAKTLQSMGNGNAVPDAAADRTNRRHKATSAVKLQRKRSASLSRKEREQRAKRGVIYIGHLPMGFLEPQLKAFFSQFGEVCRVRLFRSRKNAHTKGYAFVEFALREVAEIAAQAMDKYRMFGRTLVCRLTGKGEVQEHVFRKCHKPFKHINWQSRAAAKHNKPDDQLISAKGITTVEKRMKKKARLLQELGIDLELPVLHKTSGEAGHLSAWVKQERLEKRKTKNVAGPKSERRTAETTAA